ncbi:hypothetical protein Tco_0666326 [Tanacetum coccineum]
MKKSTQTNFNGESRSNTGDDPKNRGVKGYSSSYVNVVKGSQSLNTKMESKPALVLESTYVNQCDYSNCLMGKVKDIASLTNLKVVLGKVFWVRAKEIFGWVPDFVEENEEETDTEDEINDEEFIGNDMELKKCPNWDEDSDIELVPDSKFEEEIPKTKDEDVSVGQDEVNSEDPFKNYDLLNKKEDVSNKNANEENSLKFPPGFTPNDTKEAMVEYTNKSNESKRMSGEAFHNIQEEESDSRAKKYHAKEKAKEDVVKSMCLGHFQNAGTPRSGGSILQLMDDMVKVGQTMGYNMEEIIESQGGNVVRR